MNKFEDNLTKSITAALLEYRTIPEDPQPDFKLPHLTARETWLAMSVVNLVLYELQVQPKDPSEKARGEAVVALKEAASQIAQRFGNNPRRWPDDLYSELNAAHAALDKAEGAGL